MSSFALAKVYPLREGSQFPAGATKQRGAGWTTRRPASAAADSSHWPRDASAQQIRLFAAPEELPLFPDPCAEVDRRRH